MSIEIIVVIVASALEAIESRESIVGDRRRGRHDVGRRASHGNSQRGGGIEAFDIFTALAGHIVRCGYLFTEDTMVSFSSVTHSGYYGAGESHRVMRAELV